MKQSPITKKQVDKGYYVFIDNSKEITMQNEIIQLSLKEFVKSTLLDINSAVVEAKNEGLPIAYGQYRDGTYPSLKTVEFDIALQVSNNNETGKNGGIGVGISVVSFNFAKEKINSTQHETTNRIKFSVDMFLGSDK
jgi:hypothetical protein